MKSPIFARLLGFPALYFAVTARATTTVWQPAVGSTIQIMLSAVPAANSSLVPSDAQIFDIDLFDTPASTISALKAKGRKIICYFSAGTAENWRPDYSAFNSSDLGHALPDWQGEVYVDIKSSNVVDIMNARIKMAASKGCDGIDPDNMDAYNNGGGGFGLTQSDAISYLQALASTAESYNLATGLKNAQEILPTVRSVVQFAVNEECVADGNCTSYDDFLSPASTSSGVGKPVFHIEYAERSGNTISSNYDGLKSATSDVVRKAYCLQSGSATAIEKVAPALFSTIIKTQNLDGWVMYCDGTTADSEDAATSKALRSFQAELMYISLGLSVMLMLLY